MKFKLVTVFGLALFLLLAQFAIVSAEDGNQLFLQGLKEYYLGAYSKAIISFDKVLDWNNDHVDALYYQTLSYIELNNVTKARENISQLEALGYQFGLIHWKLGTIYLNKEGQFDSPFYNEAKKELEKAHELGINSPQFHSDLAMAYQGLGDLKKAAREYGKALSKGGEIGDYINLAALYKETGQLDKAINTYKQALNLNPDNTSIYLNLGNIYLQKGNYDSAIEVLKEGVALDPSFVAIRSKLATAYYEKGNFEKAKEQFNKVIKQNNNIYEAYYYLGEIYYNVENNVQKAIYYYNEATKKNPDYVKAYIALGNIYINQDNTYKAIAQYTTAIEKNQNYPDGHYHLAVAYHKLGMKEAAVAELRKTLHLNPDYQAARDLLSELTKE
ncbi:MAG: hypothetical protein PWR10_1305 [Halanaerobiales bacterium]|nr:hypothetical protein [Halanaerobiales bacterium]